MRFMDNLDIFKAKRDTSKLVQVQRTVSRGGTSFIQNFWVKPSDVRSTDKVVGGQQNVLPAAGSVAKPANGVLDSKYFDSIKSDKVKALDYLKSCGISWNEHSHAAINWMRAMQAYSIATSSSPQSGTKTYAQVNAQTTQNVQQSPQNSQPGNPPQSTVLTPAQQSELDTGNNGKEKTVILKKLLGNDGCISYAKQLGVTWDEHPHAAINIMRMSMALKSHFDTTDGTVSPTKDKASSGDVGAPDGNQNAKKVGAKTEKPKKETKTLLEIPEGASERDKRIIELVNSINSSEDLDTCKSVGILAEDSSAMNYLRNVLLPKAAEQQRTGGSRVNNDYSHNMSLAICSALDKTMKTMSKRVLKAGVLDGQKRTLNAVQFTSPRSLFKVYTGDGGSGYNSELYNYKEASDAYQDNDGENRSIPEFMKDFQYHFGTYNTDVKGENVSYAHFNSGVETTNQKIRKQNFEKDNDGFYRALQKIADTDPELKDKVSEMQQQYLQILELSGYNLSYISNILQSDSNLNDLDANRKRELSMHHDVSEALKQELSPEDYKKVYQKMTASMWGTSLDVSKVPQELSWRNPDFSYSKDEDPVTNPRYIKITFDISSYKSSSGKSFADEYDTKYLKLLDNEHIEQFQGDIDAGTFTVENRDKLQPLLLDLFGIELKEDGKSRWSSDKKFCKPVGDDPEKDAVLTNLLRMSDVVEARNKAIDALENKFTPSAANGKGATLENVLDFAKTGERGLEYNTMLEGFLLRGNWSNGEKKVYTPKEILDKIRSQTDEIPVVSLSKCKTLKKDLITYAEDRADKVPGSLSGGKDYQGNKLYDTRYDLMGLGSGMGVWYNTSDGNQNNTPTTHPLCDLMVENLYDLASHSPSLKTGRIKTNEDVRKTLLRNLGMVAEQTDEESGSIISKEMRKTLLNSVKCSISTVTESEFKDIQHGIKMDWDQQTHGGNSAFFYGAYKINNLAVRAKLEEAAQTIGETPEEYYHGTSFGGTKGILGTSGGFSVNRSVQSAAGASQAGSMLGEGVYLAKKSSKSAQYFGGYNYGRYGRGSLFVCDAIMGKRAKYNQDSWRSDYTFDTVEAAEASGSRGHLCNDEWAVRHAEWVVPKLIIDMENRRRV